MLIRRIRLQNIKSYTDQIIEFHEGVNFISGINGAGKSTIIEAIGYTLFDYNPYPNIKDLIHYGAKSGIITIDFCANDDRDYRVVRKIGTSSLWAVFDLENDVEIDLHGARDVREWLKDAMGVDRDINLDQLFQDIVGVPQGTFVGPFLETQAIRKKKFDAILNVEQYREAFSYTASAAKLLVRILTEKDTELRIMAEQVSEYDTVREDITALEHKVSELESKLSYLSRQIETQELAVNELEHIRLTLEKNEGELKALTATARGLEQRQQDITASLGKAREAQALIKSCEPGYNSFLEIEQRLKILETERLTKDKLEKDINKLKQEIAAGQAGIETKLKSLDDQEKETTAEKKRLALHLEETGRLSSAADKELEEARQKLAEADGWRKSEELLGQLITRLERIKADGSAKNEQLALLHEEEKTVREKLKNWAATEKLAATRGDKEKVYQKAKEEYITATTRLKTLEKNLDQSRGGLCPFLNSPCRNVEGNLEEYFTKQLREVRLELDALKEKGLRLKDDLASAEEAAANLIRLKGDKERLEQVVTQKSRLTAEIAGLLAKASAEPVAGVLHKLAAESHLDYARAGEGISAFNELLSTASLELKLSLLDDTLACTGAVLEESRKNRNALEQTLASEVNRCSAAAAQLAAEFKNHRQRLDQIKEKESRILNERNDLGRLTEIIAQMQSAMQEKENEMAGYRDLEDRLAETRQQQEVFRNDYKVFMQNAAEAGRVTLLEQEALSISQQVTENQNALNQLQISYNTLRSKYNPDDHEARKNELIRLKQEEARERQALAERRNDMEEREQSLARMKKIIAKIESLKQELQADKKTLALLDSLRGILNSAGAPIARVYLENLSRAASDLYRQVSRENAALEWREGYEIVLIDNFNGRKRERTFKQFSGGEQTTAALAVRLALLKQHSRVKLGFFDEPTSNLDSDRRVNLAETIPQVTGGFNQIFVISHDDTFDSITDNVIHIQKDPAAGSLLAE